MFRGNWPQLWPGNVADTKRKTTTFLLLQQSAWHHLYHQTVVGRGKGWRGGGRVERRRRKEEEGEERRGGRGQFSTLCQDALEEPTEHSDSCVKTVLVRIELG